MSTKITEINEEFLKKLQEQKDAQDAAEFLNRPSMRDVKHCKKCRTKNASEDGFCDYCYVFGHPDYQSYEATKLRAITRKSKNPPIWGQEAKT